MKWTFVLVSLLAMSLAGCAGLGKKDKDKKEKKEPTIPDQSGDMSFQSFIGRLRKAVANHDAPVLASMMTSDFGWRWDQPPAGETPFKYWDAHNLWPELAAVVREPWVPNGSYMTAPPQVAHDPEYRGFRAGLRQVAGSWRFAYFVPAQPEQTVPAVQTRPSEPPPAPQP